MQKLWGFQHQKTRLETPKGFQNTRQQTLEPQSILLYKHQNDNSACHVNRDLIPFPSAFCHFLETKQPSLCRKGFHRDDWKPFWNDLYG